MDGRSTANELAINSQPVALYSVRTRANTTSHIFPKYVCDSRDIIIRAMIPDMIRKMRRK